MEVAMQTIDMPAGENYLPPIEHPRIGLNIHSDMLCDIAMPRT
jgi:hypothetical protein